MALLSLRERLYLQPSSLAKRVSYFLLLIVTLFYFYGLGRLPLVGPDEPRYAQVAREMLVRRDLITPTLGGHAWFEKPVLLYWLIIPSYKIFGVTEFAARLGPAIAGVLTILAVFWLARRVEITSDDGELDGFAPWSAVVAATTLGLIVFSRAVTFDILLTMTITWATAFFFAAESEARPRTRTLFLIGFYVLVGISLLAKGLVGLLPLGIAGLFIVLRRRVTRKDVLLSVGWGLPLALAVAAMWFGPVIARNGKVFLQEFIVQHHFARFLSNKYHHPQPFFFYLVVLVPITLPWTPFFLSSVAGVRAWHWKSDVPVERMRVLALVWVMLPMVAFSFSASKLPGYILPVLPAVALLAGERLTRFIATGTTGKAAMRAVGLLAILFASGALFYARQSGAPSVKCALAVVLPVIAAGSIAAVWVHFRTAAAGSVAASVVLALVVLFNCGVDKLAQRDSVAELIEIADARGYSSLRVGMLHTIDHTAHFYASGRLIYGDDSDPKKYEGPTEVLDAVRENNGELLVLVPLEFLDQLTSLKSANVDVIADNGTMAIAVVRLK